MKIKVGKETATPFFFVSRWIGAFAALADAVVAVLTLGFYWPNLHVKVMHWQLDVEINEARKNNVRPE